MRQIVLGDEERGCQVEQAIGREHFQPGILAHGIGQVSRHVSIPHGLRPSSAAAPRRAVGVIPDLVDIQSGGDVSLLGRVFQLAVQIVVECRHKRARDAGARRIVAGSLAGGVQIRSFEPRIVPSDNQPLVAH